MNKVSFYKVFSSDWSSNVKTKWSPPEGFFKGSSSSIASGLKTHSKSKRQAMSRLNFYINRAGKNLDSKDKSRLELAKKKLSELYESKKKNFSVYTFEGDILFAHDGKFYIFEFENCVIARAVRYIKDNYPGSRIAGYYQYQTGKYKVSKDLKISRIIKKKFDDNDRFLVNKQFSLRPTILNYIKNAFRKPIIGDDYIGFIDDKKFKIINNLLDKALDYIKDKYRISPNVKLVFKKLPEGYAGLTSYNTISEYWEIMISKEFKYTKTINCKTLIMHELGHIIYETIYGRPPYTFIYRRHNKIFQKIVEDLYDKFKCPVEMTYHGDYEAVYGLFMVKKLKITEKLLDSWISMISSVSDKLRDMGAKDFVRYISYNREPDSLGGFGVGFLNTFIMDSINQKDNLLFGIPVIPIGSISGVWYGIKTEEDWAALRDELRKFIGKKIKCLLEN